MRRFSLVLAAIAILTLLACAIPPAKAQSTGPAPGNSGQTLEKPGAQPGAKPGPKLGAERGWLDRLTAEIRVRQQRYYRELGQAVRALKTDYSAETAWTLILISFVYGVFHAAGPGHGKAVIAAYMLANQRSMRRGVILAALAASAQAVTAIAAVYGFVFVLNSTGREARRFAIDLEIVSYVMITALGLWLVWRVAAPMVLARANNAHRTSHHTHGDACGHGHSHMPDPALADWPLTLANAAPIVAGIGLRPCSGAIVVLIFAHTLGFYAAGVGATLAMALGTAITVAALAMLAVGSRDIAARALAGNSRYVGILYRAVALLGALTVFTLGAVLLHAALTAPAKPFM